MRLVEYSVCLVVIGYVLGRVCKEKKIKENNMEKKKSNLLQLLVFKRFFK